MTVLRIMGLALLAGLVLPACGDEVSDTVVQFGADMGTGNGPSGVHEQQ